jgi:hypothetical protein
MKGTEFEFSRTVIHGPYQSGKTSFLWALDDEEVSITPIYFDMTGLSYLYIYRPVSCTYHSSWRNINISSLVLDRG